MYIGSALSRVVGSLLFQTEGGEAMTVFQALTLMISFSTLVVLILSFPNKKK
ncbi:MULTISPECIES: putative holin-like toxin [Brevibacillus]|nr:putative holin-like toxin [Brevibacillus laterosporus]